MRKVIFSTPSSGFKGLQPLVAANFSIHLSSSLRGSVKRVFKINLAHHCCIPEAISLHLLADERFSNVKKLLHNKVRAGRLLRRSPPTNNFSNLISQEFNTKTLLAMTIEDDLGFQGSINQNF